MENCGKLWRQEQGTAAGRKGRIGVYPIDVPGATLEMRACSACAGDYEDPDRTAWAPADDADDEEREESPGVAREEFPAEE